MDDLAPVVKQHDDVDGWESGEVCELLGISEGNQRVLVHRARSRVRGFVEERLGREAA